ncbi:MAG: mechanosensitive ion channel family protein [Lachnospiraceae bacterium]|nr:mechanosensitive ion channel family protein [Lachnospiraceae bacterium]
MLDQFLSTFPQKAVNFGIKTILCLVVFFIGAKLIGILIKLLHRSMERAKAEAGVMSFMESLVKVLLYIVLITLILVGFGVNATSLAAVLGSVGVTAGLAVQGSLSNFAGGVLILLQKPFKVGDYIYEDMHKNEGVVYEIKICYTKLRTSENRIIVLPNGDLANTSIVNYTYLHPAGARNVKVSNIRVGVAYATDIDKAKEVLSKIVEEEPLRAKERPFSVRVAEYAESAIVFNLFCEFPLENYNAGRGSIMEKIKKAFDENGISIPYPQMDVHMRD